MALGVERVRDRLLRASAALEAAGIAYAIVVGNAVAAWVATIDVAAVRNTQDVDVLLCRSDLALAVTALAGAGFVHRHAAGIEMFLDGPDAKARDALYIIFAGDKVRPGYEAPAPDVSESVKVGDSPFHVVALEALVRMKLTSFRRKDQVHLLDMLEVGLIHQGCTQRLAPTLALRLQQLLDTPEG